MERMRTSCPRWRYQQPTWILYTQAACKYHREKSVQFFAKFSAAPQWWRWARWRWATGAWQENFLGEGGGPKSLFPIYSRSEFRVFPVEISIFVHVDPFKVSVVSWKWKARKKSIQLFSVLFTLNILIFLLFFFIFQFFPHFPPSFSFFPHFPLQFPFFIFFLASFSPICHQ